MLTIVSTIVCLYRENGVTRIFTIGCGGKSAQQFFETLIEAKVRKVADVRLYNTSQLAGFAKRGDIEYFLGAIAGIAYVHLSIMAPTKELLNDYKKGHISWPEYEIRFNRIIAERQIEKHLAASETDMACLLCSEPKPDHCHRRLVAEYLAGVWQNTSICHL